MHPSQSMSIALKVRPMARSISQKSNMGTACSSSFAPMLAPAAWVCCA